MAQRRGNSESRTSSFTNGVPEMLVLRLLAAREMYGYELVRAIRDATGNSIAPGEGVIYPLLHALEREGCLATRRAEHDGRKRVYYRLTRKGLRNLGLIESDWRRMARAVQLVIGGDDGPIRAA
jgi:PadR family transcriptional regulator, regulatory protein PadR